jgi:hypothetical protein
MQIPTDWTFPDFLEHCLPPPSALSELYELEAGGISPETRRGYKRPVNG